MPYINQHRREVLDLLTRLPCHFEGPGELNYLITRLAIAYIESKDLSYNSINDVLGALEGVKQEFYQRVASPYEFKKMWNNGDVYPPDMVGLSTDDPIRQHLESMKQ